MSGSSNDHDEFSELPCSALPSAHESLATGNVAQVLTTIGGSSVASVRLSSPILDAFVHAPGVFSSTESQQISNSPRQPTVLNPEPSAPTILSAGNARPHGFSLWRFRPPIPMGAFGGYSSPSPAGSHAVTRVPYVSPYSGGILSTAIPYAAYRASLPTAPSPYPLCQSVPLSGSHESSTMPAALRSCPVPSYMSLSSRAPGIVASAISYAPLGGPRTLSTPTYTSPRFHTPVPLTGFAPSLSSPLVGSGRPSPTMAYTRLNEGLAGPVRVPPPAYASLNQRGEGTSPAYTSPRLYTPVPITGFAPSFSSPLVGPRRPPPPAYAPLNDRLGGPRRVPPPAYALLNERTAGIAQNVGTSWAFSGSTHPRRFVSPTLRGSLRPVGVDNRCIVPPHSTLINPASAGVMFMDASGRNHVVVSTTEYAVTGSPQLRDTCVTVQHLPTKKTVRPRGTVELSSEDAVGGTGERKRPNVRRKKSPLPGSNVGAERRHGCVSQGSSSGGSHTTTKRKRGRIRGAGSGRSTRQGAASESLANENDGTLRSPHAPITPTLRRVLTTSSQPPSPQRRIVVTTRKRGGARGRGGYVRIRNPKKSTSKAPASVQQAVPGRPVPEPGEAVPQPPEGVPESAEDVPVDAMGTLELFLKKAKWARRYTVTDGFYSTIEPNSKKTIEGMKKNSVGTMSRVCGFCDAKYFPGEEPQDKIYKKCCKKGIVNMSRPPPYPKALKRLFLSDDSVSKGFRRNIRQYNNACAFAAFTHNSVALTGNGPKTYSVHGQTQHWIGSANPGPGRNPQFAQLYVLDSALATQAREDLSYNSACNKEVLEKIDKTIRHYHPVCSALLNMKECEKRLQEQAESADAGNGSGLPTRGTNVKMHLGNNKKLNIRQFAPPTCSEEISVVVPEDSSDKKPERYVTIFWKDNRLQNIHFANPLLDTLLYPLLYVHGQYGYSINLFSWGANSGAPPELRPTGLPVNSEPPACDGIREDGSVSPNVTNIESPGGNAEECLHSNATEAVSGGNGGNGQHVDGSGNHNVEVNDVESDLGRDGAIPAGVPGTDYPFEHVPTDELEVDEDNNLIPPDVLPEKATKVTQMRFYAHLCHVRVGNEDKNFNPLFHSRKLFQQYLCDVYVRVEEERLGFIRREQERLRVANYKELQHQVNSFAEQRNVPVGTVVILPSSFTNGERNMVNHYRDAMAIVGKYGKPDYFITFTCNPKWEEITSNLFPGQSAVDRPDLVARVFELKLKQFERCLVHDKPFGKVLAYTYAVEHQKRGLPHVHLLLVVKKDAKPNTAEKVDTVVSAEIPCPVKHPLLHKRVMDNMIHGPCGGENFRSSCMVNNKCGKEYPKEFNDGTVIDAATYPKYRRTNNSENPVMDGMKQITNRWVVPYNAFLLMMFDAHINVEICSSLKSVKYLYKYVHKGHDKVRVVCAETGRAVDLDAAGNPLDGIVNPERPGTEQPAGGAQQHQNAAGNGNNVADEPVAGPSTQRRFQANIDEIERFIRGRYISAPEAMGRLLEFKSTKSNHTVHKLPVHLPGDQSVLYAEGMEDEALAAQNGRHTQLTAWFELNKRDPNARGYRFTEIPVHYTWNKKNKSYPEKSFTWTERKANWSIISRLHNVPPRDMQLFALRVLLLHVTGCQSFDDVKALPEDNSIEDAKKRTFLEAAVARGLLEDDQCWDDTLKEAVAFKMPFALRNLFGMILCHGEVKDPLRLWETYKVQLSEDYHENYPDQAEDMALRDINDVIVMNNRLPSEFFLPTPARIYVPYGMDLGFDPATELAISERRMESLNEQQRVAVIKILSAVKKRHPEFNVPGQLWLTDMPAVDVSGDQNLFYLDGPGGTGKTFVYITLMSIIRAQRRSVLAVATTGIAATLLPGGRTVHSRFGVPIDLQPNSTSSVKPNTENADQIRKAAIVVCDEVSMMHKDVMTVVDRLLKDLMRNDKPFGGKVVVVGGDFRQMLPVVRGGGENEIVMKSVVNNCRWRDFVKIRLTQNMRTEPTAIEFAAWLLALGDGRIPVVPDGTGQIELPDDLILKKTDECSSMVDYIYGKSIFRKDAKDHIKKAILCPLNEDTFRINAEVLNRLEGNMVTYKSCDKAVPLSGDPFDEREFPLELMNKTTPTGLPHHHLCLKNGAIIMLLRNLNPKLGMVNGARMVVTHCEPNAKVIQAKFLTGTHADKFVLIPRIQLCPTEQNTELPIRLQRTQFPVRLAYSMTINKSQGQTLERVGIILSLPVFTHGMLYTACSRVVSRDNLRIQIGPTLVRFPSNKTMNIVYTDIFQARDM